MSMKGATGTRMNTEIKTMWVEALRSGQYKQGSGHLNLDGKFCCLGVLCDLAVKAGGVVKDVVDNGVDTDNITSYDGQSMVLPQSVMDWAGLTSDNPEVVFVESVGAIYEDGIAWFNDNEFSFETLSDFIEEQL